MRVVDGEQKLFLMLIHLGPFVSERVGMLLFSSLCSFQILFSISHVLRKLQQISS
jgi:hypothetical protein